MAGAPSVSADGSFRCPLVGSTCEGQIARWEMSNSSESIWEGDGFQSRWDVHVVESDHASLEDPKEFLPSEAQMRALDEL
ncbi:MAG: hypothetical protein SGPRY_010183 [Prymnesium sp.]